MTYKTLTVGTLVDTVKMQIFGLGATTTAADTEIKKALNHILQDMVSRTDYPAFRKEGRLTTAPDTEDYWLPDDFDKMIEPSIRFEATPFTTLCYMAEADFDEISGRASYQSTARPRVYNVRWRDEDSGLFLVRMHPVPDGRYPLVFSYLSIPARIDNAALTDNIDKRFPIQFHEVLAYGASTRFPQYLSVSQLQMFNDTYQKGLLQMGKTARPIAGLVYQNKPYSKRVRNGLGDITLQSLTAPEQ